jgi:hypothetical protein
MLHCTAADAMQVEAKLERFGTGQVPADKLSPIKIGRPSKLVGEIVKVRKGDTLVARKT